MIGSIIHRKDCPWCRKGIRKVSDHPGWTITVYLPYLPKKTKTGRITHKWDITGPEVGKGFKNHADVFQYLLNIQSPLKDRKYFPPQYSRQEGNVFLFQSQYQKYCIGKQRSVKDLGIHLVPLFQKSIKALDMFEIDRLYRGLADHLAQTTKITIMSIVHAILVNCWRAGMIDSVPVFPKMKSGKQKAKKWLTFEEQLKVLEFIPEKYKKLVIFMACHGTRPQEALRIKWGQFNHKRKTVTIYATKTDKENEIAIHSLYLSRMSIASLDPNEYVFPQITYGHVTRMIGTACKKAGVERVTSYEFSRHSFASQRLAAGCTEDQVALILNNPYGIKAYKHANLELKRRVVEAGCSNIIRTLAGKPE